MATLPEEFAPKGPMLSRFPMRPAPPVRPRLFADEARFALRLSLLAGGAELAAWAWIVGSRGWLGVLVGALRASRFLWARLGVRAPRVAIGFALLFVALIAQGLSLPVLAALAAGLCAPAELCATAMGDAITVERRSAAFAWLDMAQAAGVVLGVGLGLWLSSATPAVAAAGLLLAGVGVPDLRDRGTPRSSWPLSIYASALRAPLGLHTAAAALVLGAATLFAAAPARGVPAALLPIAGMALAARLEPRMPNALALPRALAVLALVAAIVGVPTLALIVLGAGAAVLPAAVARAAEMERAPTSALVWSALALGAAAARGML